MADLPETQRERRGRPFYPTGASVVDPDEVAAIKARISELEAELDRTYARRRELMLAMDARLNPGKPGTLTRREAGALWGISNVAVTHTINGKPYGTRR